MKLQNAGQLARSLFAKTTRRPVQASATTGAATETFDTCEVYVRFAGKRLKLHVRAGTTDVDLIQQILRRDSMYRLPDNVHPRTIFDIGGNIGIAAIYYSLVYPAADIYCFEPLPENLALLRENAKNTGGRIRIQPYGLSDRTEHRSYYMSNNPRSFGGGGFSQIGHDPQRQATLPLMSVPDALKDLAVDHVDIFKIDTEGSELPILQSIPQPMLNAAQAVLGELHGIGDWQACEMLSRTHAVGVDKRYDRPCFPFIAIRKDLVAAQKTDKSAA